MKNNEALSILKRSDWEVGPYLTVNPDFLVPSLYTIRPGDFFPIITLVFLRH